MMGKRMGAGSSVAVAVVALQAAVWVGPATAQEASGLSFVGGLGYQAGGPGPDLVDALAAGGLNEIQPGTCAGSICQDSVYYPFHFREGIGLAVTLGARYRFNAPVSLEVLASNGQRGHAEGYRERPVQDHLTISYNAYVLGSTVGLHLGPVRVGAGPALLFLSWKAVENSAETENSSNTALGGKAGVAFDVYLPDTILSLRASAHRFGRSTVPNSMQIPIEAGYGTYEFGLTVTPRIH